MNCFKLFTTTLLLFCFLKGHAQLSANFSSTIVAGCSPLNVSFKNTTLNASSSALYEWDFGNGNTATNNNINTPIAAIYINEQTYIVTLKVTDGGIQSIKTDSIIVYKKPIPSFILSNTFGCVPLSVNFSSSSLAGDGTISTYSWDMGNGITFNGGDTLKNVSTRYLTPGKYTVKLSLTNSFGCKSTVLIKDSVVDALSSPKALFTKNKNYLCKAGDSVTFTNISIDTSNATYLWQLGDGTINNSPIGLTHTYLNSGTFKDKLIVTNQNGCTDTAYGSQNTFVASFKPDFFNNTTFCTNTYIPFQNTSFPPPDSAVWQFSDTAGAIFGVNAVHSFLATGNYHAVVINYWGNCVDSVDKPIIVQPSVNLDGFDVINAPLCGGKAIVEFRDTTVGSTGWVWVIEGATTNYFTKNVQYTFTKDTLFNVTLALNQATGCRATVTQQIQIQKSPFTIQTIANNSTSNKSGCIGLDVDFSITPKANFSNYLWDFGDTTTTSTLPTPNHVYNKIGVFEVKLTYTTLNGCTDTVGLRFIQTFTKPKASFSVSQQVICGNSKTYFFDQTPTPTTSWFWQFGDNRNDATVQNPVHAYFDTGYYDITFVATNGSCSDTVTYNKYVYVLPPFPLIDSIYYPCTGTRDTAYILQKSKMVVSGTWDFGDGSPKIPLDTSTRRIFHVYPKTGVYVLQLSATNGGCTTIDTSYVIILAPQKPILSANVSEICVNDSIKLSIDRNTLAPNPANYKDSNYYRIYKWQYGDGTSFIGNLNSPPNWYYNGLGYLSGLTPGKFDIRAITQSSFFGCLDTTNYIPLKIKGPLVNYSILNKDTCFKVPTFFNDRSTPTNGIPLSKWIWYYGDKTSDTVFISKSVSHQYAFPTRYVSKLTVFDNEGCYASYQHPDTINLTGPKADFSWTPTYIVTGASGTFLNSSINYGSPTSQYLWTFSSNKKSFTTKNVTINYPKSLIDTVRLIAKNPANGCTDTTIKFVTIRKVFALFDLKLKYSSVNTCPPATATLTNQSINADSIWWDFGDGTPRIINLQQPSHIYSRPGLFKIALYAYNNKQLQDSAFKYITIAGPYANIITDVSSGCIPQKIKISAVQKNTVKYAWDFGDGTVINNSTDSFQVHQYSVPGFYTPQVILTDALGCKPPPFAAPKPIFIDSLKASFTFSKFPVCNDGLEIFTPKVNSFSASRTGEILKYHWNFGTGNPIDTSNNDTASFYYGSLGKYIVSLQVTSKQGCKYNYADTVLVNLSAKGYIAAPTKACEGQPVVFASTASSPGNTWNWKFGNGDTSLLQNPPPVFFKTTKDVTRTDTVMLITKLNLCSDTTYHYLTVNPMPRINLQPRATTICEGKSIQLVAENAVKYEWSPIVVDTSISKPIVTPTDTTKYTVVATNALGCFAIDSATVFISPKMKLVYPLDTFVCMNKSVQLPVSGADNYVWLSDLATLTGQGSNPIAQPIVSPTNYQFVASTKDGCFSEIGNIAVYIKQYPTLTIADSILVLPTGTTFQFKTKNSTDVVSYEWVPSDYLSCTNCAEPSIYPRSDKNYTVSVKNAYGCSVSQKIAITLNCSKRLFLPSGFTPSSNTANNVFYPLGTGIKTVKQFKVYNRWGQLVFQNSNFNVGDKSAGWDGNYGGTYADVGTYLYTIEAQCDTGDIFSQKGYVVLIR